MGTPGNLIQSHLEKQRLSLVDFARKEKLKQGDVHELMYGKPPEDPIFLHRVSLALGVDADLWARTITSEICGVAIHQVEDQPRGRAWMYFLSGEGSGKSIGEIAEGYGTTEKSVRRILRGQVPVSLIKSELLVAMKIDNATEATATTKSLRAKSPELSAFLIEKIGKGKAAHAIQVLIRASNISKHVARTMVEGGQMPVAFNPTLPRTIAMEADVPELDVVNMLSAAQDPLKKGDSARILIARFLYNRVKSPARFGKENGFNGVHLQRLLNGEGLGGRNTTLTPDIIIFLGRQVGCEATRWNQLIHAEESRGVMATLDFEAFKKSAKPLFQLIQEAAQKAKLEENEWGLKHGFNKVAMWRLRNGKIPSREKPQLKLRNALGLNQGEFEAACRLMLQADSRTSHPLSGIVPICVVQENLISHMADTKRNIKDIARQTGIPPRELSPFLKTGRLYRPKEHAAKLARLLGMSPEEVEEGLEIVQPGSDVDRGVEIAKDDEIKIIALYRKLPPLHREKATKLLQGLVEQAEI